MTPPILRVDEVSKSFGGVRAVDGCSLSVQPRTLTGLIGPNGAGKSTLFNLIAGLYAPDSGSVLFEGQHIEGLRAHAVVRRGLVKTFQIPREFRNLTVLENLLVAAQGVRGTVSRTSSSIPSRRGRTRRPSSNARSPSS